MSAPGNENPQCRRWPRDRWRATASPAILAESRAQPPGRGRGIRGTPTLDEQEDDMKRYVIERTIPGAGKLTGAQLHDISAKSCDVLRSMGKDIQWEHSYVTGDKVYCVYLAESPELLQKHASLGGFPIDRVSEVASIIDPTSEN
jgi:hypothetical protein